MCERAVAQKALLRTRGQTEMRSWKFDSAGAVAITGILGEQCNQVDNSVPGRRGEERERQTKNRDESSRHRSLSLSRHHWVGLGVLWELVRRWTFVFDSHKAVSPPQQPVNILYGFTVKEKVASALAPSTRSTPADTRYQRDRAAGCAFEKCRVWHTAAARGLPMRGTYLTQHPALSLTRCSARTHAAAALPPQQPVKVASPPAPADTQ